MEITYEIYNIRFSKGTFSQADACIIRTDWYYLLRNER